MSESVLSFGRDGSLVGVLTKPEQPTRAPHLLVLNSGFIHHVGPGRLAVEIARRMRPHGFATLRFDFSGIGDSAPRVPPLDAIQCGIADAKDAMDHLEQHEGAKEFVLVGLCSGARHAHHIATADRRVVGAVLLDGYAFATPRALLMNARDRLDDPLALLAGARRRAMRLIGAAPAPPPRRQPDDDGEAFFPGDPTREKMAADLRTLAARKVALLAIFSGEWRTYRYEGQLQDAFPQVPLKAILSEHLIETADHLYFTQPERAQLMSTVTAWLRQRYA